MPLWATVLLVWCGMLSSGKCALACSCAEGSPPCQEAWRAAAVFAGTVAHIEILKGEPQSPLAKVTLAVTESFIGLKPDTRQVDILTPVQAPACGFAFERGRSYLVYAEPMPSGGPLSTSACSGTSLLEKASADLAYLRSLPTRKPLGEIIGLAFDSQFPMSASGASWPWRTLPNVRITIHSDKVQKSTTTGANGHFAFRGLPPNSYTVTAAASGYWPASRNPINAPVPAKGCADLNFDLNIDRVVSGHLFDPLGKPVPNVTIDLVPTQRELGQLTAKSDTRGHYEFRGVPKGDYYLGVTLTSGPRADHPYQRWYYPGVPDRAKAVSLSVNEVRKLVTADLPLPEAQQEIAITGIVQWPDGRPAPDIDVLPEYPEFPFLLGSLRATTDKNGKFQVKLFDKTTYAFYAAKYESSPRKDTSVEPLTIVPGQLKKGAIVRLVLSHNGDLVTPELNRRVRD